MLKVTLYIVALEKVLGVESDKLSKALPVIDNPWKHRRRGVEKKMVVGEPMAKPDQTLIRLLARAHQWVTALRSGVSLTDLARKEKVTKAYIRTRSRLAFLAPNVQQAILFGTLDPSFTANRILSLDVPLDWKKQEQLFRL